MNRKAYLVLIKIQFSMEFQALHLLVNFLETNLPQDLRQIHHFQVNYDT
jgi:hypothetical protein